MACDAGGVVAGVFRGERRAYDAFLGVAQRVGGDVGGEGLARAGIGFGMELCHLAPFARLRAMLGDVAVQQCLVVVQVDAVAQHLLVDGRLTGGSVRVQPRRQPSSFCVKLCQLVAFGLEALVQVLHISCLHWAAVCKARVQRCNMCAILRF